MTIYSTADGQVIRASDAQGIYYYLADGLGTPTVGYWTTEVAAIAALEGRDGAACEGEIDERGERA